MYEADALCSTKAEDRNEGTSTCKGQRRKQITYSIHQMHGKSNEINKTISICSSNRVRQTPAPAFASLRGSPSTLPLPIRNIFSLRKEKGNPAGIILGEKTFLI